MPDGWQDQDNYELRYAKDKKLYILMGIKLDDLLILNFVVSLHF